MSDNGLTARELVKRSLAGQDVPRPAIGPLAVHYCAQVAGVSIRQYTTDPCVLADSVVQYYERFRPDAVWLSADTWVTAQAMGAAVAFPGDDQPMGGTGKPVIRSAADIDRIPPADVSSQGRLPLMLEALRRIRDRLGDQVFVVACFDQYPFSLACATMGINTVMMKLLEDRSEVDALMERCLEYGLAYARALADAGADMLSGGDSPAGLIGPRLYRDVALPFEQRLVAAIQQSSALPVSLHICGDATAILPDMASSGANVLELDHQVNMADASSVVGPDVAIWGNLDPVGVLADAATDQVRRATRDLLQTVHNTDRHRFVLSSGCTLAMETPPENLQAMVDVARNWPVDAE